MKWVTRLELLLPEMLRLLEQSVNMDSPSQRKDLTDRMIDWYEEICLSHLDARAIRVPNEEYADRLEIHVGSGQRRILLIGHADTVWPAGECAQRPFRIEGDRAYGPGVLDMKAGIIQAIFALKVVQEMGRLPADVTFILLINSDEEIGSPSSRLWIEEHARSSQAAFVLEPPMEPEGAVKTARKGNGRYHLQIEGRAAHSGVNPAAGVSAIHEMARHILSLQELSDDKRGIHVNVGIVNGGIGSNVVAPQAEAYIDIRVETMEDFNRMAHKMQELAPIHPEIRLQIEGQMNRPPMERTAAIMNLYHLAQQVAKEELNLPLPDTSTGGVSDGNFVAACGTPTLDGMGARGDGAHALHEYVLIADIPKRAALLAGILVRV